MALHLPDKWVWDFWFARDGAEYHVFYLQADRALQREEQRHWNVSVGHAVSTDLRRWTVLDDALHPAGEPTDGNDDAWDSYTTWTGSVIQYEDLWYMFYTGSRLSERGLVQRVGLATSPDLLRWEKHPANPLITADPRWYEMLDLDSWHDHAWRDPYVFQHPVTGEFHALMTARSHPESAPPDARGVIGHARSSDLIQWEVLPPLTPPGEFGHMEVPQLIHINDRYYLLFSVPYAFYANARKTRLADQLVTGTHYLVADDPLGPYQYITDEFLVGDYAETLYSGKLIQGPDDAWYFLAFANFDADGAFVGDLIDPLPVEVHADGRLTVRRSG